MFRLNINRPCPSCDVRVVIWLISNVSTKTFLISYPRVYDYFGTKQKKKDWNNCQRSSSTHSFWPSWCTAPLYYPTIHSIFTAVALCCLFCSSELPLNGLPSSDRLLGCPITKSDWRSGRLCWWIPGMCRHTDCGRLGLKDNKAFKKSLNDEFPSEVYLKVREFIHI